MSSITLVEQFALEPGQPLWQRAPTRDAEGRTLNDFMMLIPRLGRRPEVHRQQIYQELQQLFAELEETVVFADLNLKLNLLWVSLRPCAGGCIGVAAEIKARIPEAVLIASQAEAMAGMASKARRRSWRLRLPRIG